MHNFSNKKAKFFFLCKLSILKEDFCRIIFYFRVFSRLSTQAFRAIFEYYILEKEIPVVVGEAKKGVEEKMSKNVIDYSQEKYPAERLPVGIDFSNTNVINHPSKENYYEREIRAELVSFSRSDKTIRPYKSKIQLGSYITKDNLQKILKKDSKDRSLYSMMDNIRKKDRPETELRKDFDLLRDFFPNALVLEVEDFCQRIISKIESQVEEETSKSITPRRRRAFVLAIFRSVCRKNGRKITEELMEEVNERFGYKRKMKLFEIYKAENELIHWNLLAKKKEKVQDNLRTFFLNVINHFNKLNGNSVIKKSKEHQEIILLTKKYIMNFSSKKEKQEALIEITRHKDNDFAARLIIWCIAKYFAQEVYNYNFKNPEEIQGWKSLFLIDSEFDTNQESIPIRSFKYIFWSEFALRKELKALNLYPS